MREAEIEKKCREIVESKHGHLLKWVSPGALGVPDRILLMPGGTTVFVEFKRPGGERTARQRTWGDWLEDNHFDYWLIDSVDEFDYLLNLVIG